MLAVAWILVALATASAVPIQTESPEDLMQTPFGLVPRRCLHGVDDDNVVISTIDGKTFLEHPNKTKEELPGCSQPPLEGNSWQVYAAWNAGNGSDIDQFLGQWNVPDAPKENYGQLLYAFTGLQDENWIPQSTGRRLLQTSNFDIIQPVMQYGYSPAGGGWYWAIASWYVTLGSDVVFSKLQKVSNGASIFGNMTRTGGHGFKDYPHDYQRRPSQTQAPAMGRPSPQPPCPASAHLPQAYVTLETYGVDSCDQYPTQPMEFTNLELFQGGKKLTPEWKSLKQYTKCNQQCVVKSATEVDIQF